MAIPSKYTAFRCPVDLLEKAKVRAEAERRSLSNYLICLIEKDTHGVEAPAKSSKNKKR
jgi:hypothetical protein